MRLLRQLFGQPTFEDAVYGLSQAERQLRQVAAREATRQTSLNETATRLYSEAVTAGREAALAGREADRVTNVASKLAALIS